MPGGTFGSADFRPYNEKTGSAFFNERNVPLGSAHRSSDALVAYTGRGAINDISMC